jgi:hypothetical protein
MNQLRNETVTITSHPLTANDCTFKNKEKSLGKYWSYKNRNKHKSKTLITHAFIRWPWIFLFFWILSDGVHSGSTRHCGHYWPIVPAPGDYEDGKVSGMNGFGRGNRNKYSEKTCPDATLSTTNPTCQARARTRAAVVGSHRLTASALARPGRGFLALASATLQGSHAKSRISLEQWFSLKRMLMPVEICCTEA